MAANVLATVTGATAASRFGVAGTLAGTVVMSFASSAGTTVYQYYLNRGGDKVRAIHPAAVPRTRELNGAMVEGFETADSGTGHGTANGGTVNGGTANGGSMATVGGGSRAARTVAGNGLPGGPADEPAVNGHAGAPSPTLVHFPSVSGFPSAAGGFPSVSGGVDSPPGGNGSSSSKPLHGTFPWRETDWKRVAVAAAVTLVLAIAVISVIELVAGRPLGAIVRGQHASGTSIGTVLGRHPGTGQSHVPSAPGSSAPAQTPQQPARSTGPTPAGPQPTAPAPVPTVPANRPASGVGGGTGNGVSPAPTP